NASFQRADGNLLPIQTSACDLFISFETVEHIREDLSFIKEAARVLKPDGTFICSTPNRIVSNPGASLTDKPWNPFHVREYSIEELKTLLGHYFKIEECFGQNPNRKWKIELLNWIGKNINKAVPVYLSKLWKLSWLFIEDKTRHKVRGVLPGFHYEYLVVVCKKNRQLLLLLFEQIKNALLTAYHNESSRMFSKIIF
ncbi:MAG TPA: hypothetical protein DCP55_07945, partial [Chitinophagaceae bacterium]|nr:hypothetical protein [Chitinophagaceae bacterium]